VKDDTFNSLIQRSFRRKLFFQQFWRLFTRCGR